MKLVCASNFRNTVPDRIEVQDEDHPKHVPKGARFEIGGETPFEKLSASDKRLVGELNNAGRIVEESQKDLVAKIDKEVADAAKAEKAKLEAANPKK